MGNDWSDNDSLVESVVAIYQGHHNNKYVLSSEPNERQVKLGFTDDDARPGESHPSYVPIQQADGNLAWASPIWITRKP